MSLIQPGMGVASMGSVDQSAKPKHISGAEEIKLHKELSKDKVTTGDHRAGGYEDLAPAQDPQRPSAFDMGGQSAQPAGEAQAAGGGSQLAGGAADDSPESRGV